MKQLAIQTYGAGEPLVLLHGWGFDKMIWQEIVPDLLSLPTPYQLFLVDLPGFGDSPCMPWSQFKTQLLAVLPARFTLLGWSLGGLFATRLAREASARVKQVLQVASTPYFMQSEDWAGITSQMLDDFYQKFAQDPVLTRQHFVQAQLPPEHTGHLSDHTRLSGSHFIFGLREGLMILKNWDLRATLFQLTMPVSYLFGRLDRIVSHKTLVHLQKRHPHFQYTLLPRSGHMPFLSHRAEFLDWLKEV